MTKIILLTMGLTMLTASHAWAEDDASPSGKLKVETIRIEGSQGVIEEERVPAMRSEIRYVPTGSAEGYNLVDSTASQGTSQNAHQDNDMMIPSWNLFSW
ncbi:hypothetical protein [Thiothrix nivea]|uniref:Uncharacterized protein n=1 Tax=Thiothrix nivea (strain ATCC 35100 / DSM 5205 / JP2) TaxID=870187 RepID=A0A656HKE9_THINJ|nr:hypothetical protein [Thiothrix nivea]EIJ35749.1 hypothetical protein Thini_3232 [Thiothrix nivea DSM 5205]